MAEAKRRIAQARRHRRDGRRSFGASHDFIRSSKLTQNDAELIRRGVGLIEQNCTRGCHKFGEHGQLGLAPDLTGYGSYEWMLGFVSDPAHERFYRQENDRMPSFAKDLAHPENNNLSVRELSLIVDWLRGDYYNPEDKQPVLPHDQDAAERSVALARRLRIRGSRSLALPPPAPKPIFTKPSASSLPTVPFAVTLRGAQCRASYAFRT